MGTPTAQIGSEQLHLAPGRVLLIEGEGLYDDAFRGGVDCLARETCTVPDGAAALERLGEGGIDAVLVPHQLADMSGLELLRALRDRGAAAGSILVVPPDREGDGSEALELGARDYLVQPLRLDKVMASMSMVATIQRLAEANEALRSRMNELKNGSALVGHSPAARRLSTILARAAESSVTVLIEGPVGSGKSLAGQVIHASSRLSDRRLEIAYSDTLTGERIDALLTDEHLGTLLIENVELLIPEVQSRIVRHIKEQSGRPVERQGVRIIATTAAHLPELVARNRFREDLYYRLNMFPLAVPSLRERRDDVAELAAHFLKRATERTGDAYPGFTEMALAMLEGHSWPGNVAQLQDTIVRANLLARGLPIDRRHLQGVTTGMTSDPETVAGRARPASADDDAVTEEDILPLETEEKRLLARALRATQGNVRRASQLLRIGRATLYRKIQVYKLKLN